MCTTNKIEDERGTQLFDNKEPYEFNICNDLLFDITIVFARNLSENMGHTTELRVFWREEGAEMHLVKGLF